MPSFSASLARSTEALLGSASTVVRGDSGICWWDVILILGSPVRVFDFALDFFKFMVFETVASTGVLVSCDGAEDGTGVAAGLALSPGMTGPAAGVVDVVVEDFEVDFILPVVRAIS